MMKQNPQSGSPALQAASSARHVSIVVSRAVEADSRIGRPSFEGPDTECRCFHCGTPCRVEVFRSSEKAFCCQGCLAVFELLTENDLADFYSLADTAGVRVKAGNRENEYRFLDEPRVSERLVNYQDERLTRVTFRLPAIHCIACVWLLENLFRLKPGIGASQVNFPRKEVAISYETGKVKLSAVVALLASLGYEPELKLSDLEQPKRDPAARRLWLQLGYAGFAFGNLMLFSIAGYFGLDTFSGPAFRKLVGFISLLLAIPVVTYSSLYYWRTAWVALRQKRLAIEVPIAAGIVAIFGQSTFDVLTGRGEGYFDSLCGLLFFLLCGRLFQQKTYERLSFERDYKSFFPLSITRHTPDGDESVSLSEVRVADRLAIRNGELIPADSTLVKGDALIDYSFVTGESEPVAKGTGDYIYAGGRQIGGTIEVQTTKAVSQSYLTSLWNQEAFRKDKTASVRTLINVFSYRFTLIVMAVAAASAAFWILSGDVARGFKAFTSVLIVACPCALALASPFALGSAIRALGRRSIFVKNPEVIELLAKVSAIVFDKTGTLTAAGAGSVEFHGAALSESEVRWIVSVARHSTHPLAIRISDALGSGEPASSVRSFREQAGAGVEGCVYGHEIVLGSSEWMAAHGVAVKVESAAVGSVVHVAIDGKHRGAFVLVSALRQDTEKLIAGLTPQYDLTLLSGDNARDHDRFAALFGRERVQFNHSPLSKFEFVRNLQRHGKTVMMVGDGLNDAGALKQSDVGVAVVESISAFSPASDIIMSAGKVPRLERVLRFSRSTTRIVRASFVISSLYNVIGVSIAAAGLLAPVVCAILMPLSSITVAVFASGMTNLAARRLGSADAPERRTELAPQLQEAA